MSGLHISVRLVFTSDGVGVVTGVVESVYDLRKAVNATEWESEETVRFHFLLTPLMTLSFP